MGLTGFLDPGYRELERRLAAAEGQLQALRDGRIRAIDGTQGPLVVRPAGEEARADHIKQVLLAIRNVNQLIVSEEDPRRLIERTCLNLTETMGYRSAWIALLDGKASASGAGGGCFSALHGRLAEGAFPGCMNRALAADGIVVVKDPGTECAGCPMAADFGGGAALSRRLRHGGRTYGVLTVLVPEAYARDGEEQALFEEMAGDLAFALHKIEVARDLSESQSDLQRAQALTRVGSWRFDLNTGLVIASAETRRIYGLDASEWTIPRVQTVPLPEYRGLLNGALKGLIEEGRPYDIEFRIRRPSDGQVKHIHSVAEYDAGRRIVVGTIQDITERKQTEEALRESEERNRLLSDVTMEGILIHRDAVALDVNPALARMLGYERGDLLHRDFMEFIHPDDRSAVRGQMAKQYAAPYTVRMTDRRGRLFQAEIESRDFRHQGALCRVSAVRDVTDRKALEDRLRQAQKMESVGRLAGGVAHDFNNMLSVILGYSEMALERMDADHPLRDHLQQIHNAARRSAEITKQLLAFARKQTIAPLVLDLNRTVEGMLKMLRRLIGEDIELDWLPGTDLRPVRMDPSQIDQILANLCVNSRDAIAGVGRISIRTEAAVIDDAYCASHPGSSPGDFVLLSVRDDGCGMDRGTLENLFEPFFTTKERNKGTGLGLATVYGIVKQNQGFLHVDSVPGRGTVLHVYLPAHKGAAPDAAVQAEAHPGAREGETILLVEDESEILRLTTAVLEQLGYAVLTAHKPERAILLAQRHAGPIQLLMTDVVMPGMNGRDLARLLLSSRPDLKILFMSGYTADVIAHHGVLDPGVRFLQKPFTMSDVAVKVRQVLDDAAPGPAAAFGAAQAP